MSTTDARRAHPASAFGLRWQIDDLLLEQTANLELHHPPPADGDFLQGLRVQRGASFASDRFEDAEIAELQAITCG